MWGPKQNIVSYVSPSSLGVLFRGSKVLLYMTWGWKLACAVWGVSKVTVVLAVDDKETLTLTYKAIGRSLINYCAPIYTPYITDTHWQRLQRTQNTALRLITGCHRMTHIPDLHRETNLLPVKEHNYLLSSQYNLACHSSTHPNYHLTRTPNAPRNKQPEIPKTNLDQLTPLLDEDKNLLDLKTGLKELHTLHVRNTLENYPPNTVLNARPPKIHKDETHLSRPTRTTLAQLRTGYSKTLQSYMHRLDPTIPDICPDCLLHPHTTQHLFNCPTYPTDLTPTDLWTKPIECARYLGLTTPRLPPEPPE